MRYLLLLWSVDDDDPAGTAPDPAEWLEYEAALKNEGAFVAGGILRASADASWVTTVQSGHPTIRADEADIYDTAELGAFVLLEAADFHTAELLARRMPAAGDVEVRPFFEDSSR